MTGEPDLKFDYGYISIADAKAGDYKWERRLILGWDERSALDEILRYEQPDSGAYLIEVRDPRKDGGPVVARYFSSEAVTEMSAPEGKKEWRDGGLYVDGEKVPQKNEIIEILGETRGRDYGQRKPWMEPKIAERLGLPKPLKILPLV